MQHFINQILERSYEGSIPEGLREHPDEYFRARTLVLVSSWSAILLSLFAVTRFYIQGMHVYPITLLVVIGFVLLTPSVMKRTASIQASGLFLTSTVTCGLLLMSMVDGGILSPTIFALLLMPIFAIFFGGLRQGILVTAVITVSIVFLCVATIDGWIAPVPFPDDFYTWLFGASALALMIVLVSIASLFIVWQRNIREGLLVASRAKDDFLSGMSHELRTPLNSMMGFTDVLLHGYAGELNEQQTEHLKLVYASGEHLSELVEDLVNLTNLDAGKVTLSPVPLNFEEFIRSCASAFEVEARNRNVSVELAIGDLPPSVEIDDTRVRQILTNLLSNALKFSPVGGRIRIRTERNGPILEVSISDSGKGVAPQHREHIFDKFYQAESALSGKTVGSGLGLYIARRLAALHGGRLRLDPTAEGVGATFVLTLPIKNAAGDVS